MNTSDRIMHAAKGAMLGASSITGTVRILSLSSYILFHHIHGGFWAFTIYQQRQALI
jgi:hypothetical protein